MTRKDYELIASTIRNSFNHSHENKAPLVRGFVTVLQKDNPRFDESRFIEACGYSSQQALDCMGEQS